MINLCFRFDDLSARSNHAVEALIFRTFAANRIPLTIAAVPYSHIGNQVIAFRSSDAVHVMDGYRAGTIEIAQHGFSHANRSPSPSGKQSEFAGVERNVQGQLIEQGRRCLTEVFGTRPLGFVPPWNSYDAITAEILARTGYRYISAGWEMPTSKERIVCVPRTTSLNDLESAIATARRFEWFSPAVVVVLHDYDFEESGEVGWSMNVRLLDKLLAWVNAQPSLATWTIGGAVERGLSSSTAVRWNAWRRRFPYRLRKLFPEAIIVTNPFQRSAPVISVPTTG